MLKYLAKDFITEEKPYRSFLCAESRDVRLHCHDFWEIAYVYEGIGKHHTPEGIRTLKEGDYIVLSPGIEHTITSSEKSWIRVCNCLFTEEYFKNVLKDYLKIGNLEDTLLYQMLNTDLQFYSQLSDNDAQTVKNSLWTIKHEFIHKSLGADEVVSNSLKCFLIEATRNYEALNRNTHPVVVTNNEIEDLIKYMRYNLSSHLTLDLLAAQIHLSPEYLSRYFKQYTGKNISHYLLEIRMEKARQLLRSTSYSIADIGAHCGYPLIGNFQKYFKKVMNMSPSQYRKIYLQKNN
jgi:AraC-type DNA-binding domain-containing proteins